MLFRKLFEPRAPQEPKTPERGPMLISGFDTADIEALTAANLPASLPDLDFAVINGNYALPAGLGNLQLAAEDASGEAAQVFANVVAVREGDESRPEIQTLIEVLKSDEMKDWITENYQGSVLPAE